MKDIIDEYLEKNKKGRYGISDFYAIYCRIQNDRGGSIISAYRYKEFFGRYFLDIWIMFARMRLIINFPYIGKFRVNLNKMGKIKWTPKKEGSGYQFVASRGNDSYGVESCRYWNKKMLNEPGLRRPEVMEV